MIHKRDIIISSSSSVTTHFEPPTSLHTAVLFLVFNRPDTTKQVFETIRKAKPPRLYIAADGPRTTHKGENICCAEVREISTNIDWQCEVKTLFRDKNLGCRQAVSSAIDWFFENEVQGIILEDDCVPSQSFFWYCQELLDRYKDDKRVWHISGYNHFPNRITMSDYFFSKMPGIWGWATWRNRWFEYDVNLQKNVFINLSINTYFHHKNIGKYWNKIFSNIKNIDTWDYQWTFTIISNNGLCIRPSKNLVINIGFGKKATHTKNKNEDITNNLYSEIDTNKLIPPISYIPNEKEDLLFFKKRLKKSLFNIILIKIAKCN